jgi:hypothetical protein
VSASLSDLAGSAQKLLDLFVAKLEGVVDLPMDGDGNVIAYISAGPEAGGVWDQPSVQCFINDLQQGMPGKPNTSGNLAYQIAYTVVFAIVVLRPVSVFNDQGFPQPAQQAADAVLVMDDLAAMAMAGTAIRTSGEFEQPGVPMVVGSVTPLAPMGGIAGNMITFEVQAS